MSDRESPLVMVDAIVERNDMLLVKRKKEPFRGYLSFPDGHRRKGEDSVKRELREETSLEIELKDILGAYSDPARDTKGT
jgi:8-oxo-dGTP diphosphatase